ncbi:MAG: Smr/MutS family protein [Bacteroidota bacterium]
MRLSDDGSTVTLDLHGARVDDAVDLLRRTVAAAADRGRATVRVVHGSSTSDRLARNHTIKHAIHDLLDDHALPDVTSDFRSDTYALLSLGLGGRRDPRRLTLRDVW